MKPGLCAYCLLFTTHLTRDHVFPKSKFPKPRPILMVCESCNSKKGALTLQEWVQKLDKSDPIKNQASKFLTWTPEMFKNFKDTQLKSIQRNQVNKNIFDL